MFLLCLAIASLLLMALVYTPRFQSATNGLRPLDLNRQLDVETIYTEVAIYSAESRGIYVRFALVDFVYPAAAAGFFALVWSRMLGNADGPYASALKRGGILLLPLLYMLIDWLENTGFLIVIFGYPEKYPVIAASAAALKGIKSYVLYVLLLMTLVFFAAALRRSRHANSDAGASGE